MYKWDGGFSLVEGKKGAFIKNRPALTSSDLGGQMKEFSLSAENAENSVLAPSAGLWLWKVNRSLCNLTQVHWVVNVIVWVCGFCYFRLAFYPPPPWLSAPPWRVSPRSNYPHLSGVHPLCAACSLCQLVCSLFPESVPVSPSLISPWCVSCFWFLVLSCFSVFFFCFAFVSWMSPSFVICLFACLGLLLLFLDSGYIWFIAFALHASLFVESDG